MTHAAQLLAVPQTLGIIGKYLLISLFWSVVSFVGQCGLRRTVCARARVVSMEAAGAVVGNNRTVCHVIECACVYVWDLFFLNVIDALYTKKHESREQTTHTKGRALLDFNFKSG
eukprot:08755_6